MTLTLMHDYQRAERDYADAVAATVKLGEALDRIEDMLTDLEIRRAEWERDRLTTPSPARIPPASAAGTLRAPPPGLEAAIADLQQRRVAIRMHYQAVAVRADGLRRRLETLRYAAAAAG